MAHMKGQHFKKFIEIRIKIRIVKGLPNSFKTIMVARPKENKRRSLLE